MKMRLARQAHLMVTERCVICGLQGNNILIRQISTIQHSHNSAQQSQNLRRMDSFRLHYGFNYWLIRLRNCKISENV